MAIKYSACLAQMRASNEPELCLLHLNACCSLQTHYVRRIFALHQHLFMAAPYISASSFHKLFLVEQTPLAPYFSEADFPKLLQIHQFSHCVPFFHSCRSPLGGHWVPQEDSVQVALEKQTAQNGLSLRMLNAIQVA